MEVFLIYNDGWISEKFREELLGSCSFNITDFISSISSKEKKVYFYILICSYLLYFSSN